MRTFIYFLLLSLFFCACSDTTVDNSNSDRNSEYNNEVGNSATPNPVIELKPNKKRSTLDTKKMIARCDTFKTNFAKLYDKVMYLSYIDDQLYFFVLKGLWKDEYWDNETQSIKKGGYKIGLVNEKNETIIPIQYDKIYNMGGTAANLIVTEINGKLGAYNIDGTSVVPANFDGIYPYKGSSDIWVQLRKGNKYGWLSRQGVVSMDKSSHSDSKLFEAPNTSNWNFDSKAETFHPIVELKSSNSKTERNMEFNGMIFTPSYIYQLGIVPEYQDSWIYQSLYSSKELMSTTASIINKQEVGGGISALVTTFAETGIASRDFHNENSDVVTVNKNMEPIDILTLPLKNIEGCSNNIKCSFVGDLLEVCCAELTDYSAYQYPMTNYNYYQIGKDGKISPYEITGDFKFTRALKITEDYFSGCFVRDVTAEEEGHTEQGDYVWAILSHLTIEDLDVMRNEIFAVHGYKFKSQKWQKYFQSKSWYRPQFDNIDNKLTEIEKHNIKVILARKKKMKGNEGKYIKKSFGMPSAAG